MKELGSKEKKITEEEIERRSPATLPLIADLDERMLRLGFVDHAHIFVVHSPSSL